MIKIERALISVSDKTNLVEFCKFLDSRKIEIISTGGTLKVLRENGIEAIPIQEYTGYPEILDGRVKTLHPKVHAGILGDLDKEFHKEQLEKLNISSIDLVVVNLYPFVSTIQKEGITLSEAIEQIDIGGPSLLRASAKNNKFTVVVPEVTDYQIIQEEMEKNNDCVPRETSFQLAAKAFGITAVYDSAISSYLQQVRNEKFPKYISLGFQKKQNLRYGENPHQEAAYYESVSSMQSLQTIQGKELSFNNILDFQATLHSLFNLPENSAAIIKHLNPCGIASTGSPLESFQLARRTDPASAFGSVIGINGIIDGNLASTITENFVEGVLAKGFTEEAKDIFAKKQNIRLIHLDELLKFQEKMDFRPVAHGILVQDTDLLKIGENQLKVVTKKQLEYEDIKGLMFAWTTVKLIKSNAIVFTDKNSTLGIGAGQMSRVDSVDLAIIKAKTSGLSLEGSYVGSDAFFPFRDNVDKIAKTGARAIIQPGGSIRDKEVIEAADEYNLIMVFTGIRHFRH
ncbi:MAG: bifunctional phosphoribosylaminoimidazolecarboxamide formyltransferase/IMP cyclohydrolase [Leptospiraceae bacterium]|nr:bifunctional phosphoribosylaminoimidazolecarboxamide formyltransferase/IMP cyclohydrolase [Leptospiraceae bacterium]MCP5496364.1 bifunctional phosphoribosylaminoimidazolecarboxamide formyltransferase/IMP cyclohydrolase [Leptospiraceae bacterium]